MREAGEMLKRGPRPGEKAWGATSQIVKAPVTREGRFLRTHTDLWRYVSEPTRRLGGTEVSVLWIVANHLHQNFYENVMPLEQVELAVRRVEGFVERLKALLGHPRG